jgi:LuxR family maltose regulon positive regulatory protein
MSSLQASLCRADRVVRPELLDLVDRSRDFALTLILAPAGSGKTTLINQWQRSSDSQLTARLSLGRGDSDPLLFLQHLNNALRRTLPDFAVLSCNALNAEVDQAEPLAAALADALNAVPHELFLLIDDFHYACAPLIQRIFARLLEDLPEHVHLIISSRSHPGFSLSRLKLEDQLLMIDSHDLRLPAEYLPALCTALGVPLPDEARTQDLLRLTEGWLAGLKLALLARSHAGHLTLDGVHSGQPELVDYFADVVLDGLPAPERDFLLATAILEQFTL